MPVPGTQELRKPLLETFRDEAPHNFSINDFLGKMAELCGVDTMEMSSSEKTAFKNNINEAKTFLLRHGLLSHPSKSTYMITPSGMEIIDDNPEIIDDVYLSKRGQDSDPEIIPLPPVTPVASEEDSAPEEINAPKDFTEEEFNNAPEEIIEPEESEPENETITVQQEPQNVNVNSKIDINNINLDDVFKNYNLDLAEQILQKVTEIPSDNFEMLVIDLLSKMGYNAFHNARYTDSDLIHGVIIDVQAGTTPIYIQARKLSPAKTIGRSDMQDFINEIQDKGGKGLFATTANFSEQAVIAANDERIMLIDGQRLANLMIVNNFCVNIERIFEVKSIDLDSFSEYEN